MRTDQPQPQLTADRLMVLSAIRCLISNNDCLRSEADKYLVQLCNTKQVYLLQTVLQLIRSHQGTDAHEKHMSLLYLRNLIKTSKSCLPSHIAEILHKSTRSLYKYSSNLAQLSKQCFILFISKPKHQKYKKAYVDGLINTISVTLTEDRIIDIDVIENVIAVLGNPTMKKKCGMIFSNKNQKITHHIITKYSTGLENADKQIINSVSSHIWVSFILALCNYSGFVPPLQFIYKNLIQTGLYPPQILTLTQLLIKTHYKFASCEQLYQIINAQVGRLKNYNFVSKLQQIQEDSEDMFGVMVKSIELAICDILDMYIRYEQQNEKSKLMFGVSIIQDQEYKDVYSPDFYVGLISSLLNSYTAHFVLSSDHAEIASLASTCLQKYMILNDFDVEGLNKYTSLLCLKLKQDQQFGMQIIYWLMANIKPYTMQYFNYSNAILYGIQDFNTMCLDRANAGNNIYKINQMDNGQHNQNNKEREEHDDEIWSHFIAMMEHYVKDSHQEHTNVQTFQLIKSFIEFCLTSAIKNINLHLRCLIFSLYCQCQIRFQLKSIEQFQKSLQFGYILLNQCFAAVSQHTEKYSSRSIQLMGSGIQGQTSNSLNSSVDSQSIQIVLDSLRDISLAATSPQSSNNSCILYLHKSLLSYLQSSMSSDSSCVSTYLPHLLAIIQSYITIQLITPTLISTLSKCLSTSNQTLQMQACSLYLHILVLFNRSNANLLSVSMSPCHSLHFYSAEEVEGFIESFENTGIVRYIQQRFKEEEDEILYTRILMELVIYPSMGYKIKLMLERVIAGLKQSLDYGYYFDVVIEALAILYNFQNQYSKHKGISSRVDDIRMGHMEKLMSGLNVNDGSNQSLENQDIHEFGGVINFMSKEIKWHELTGVRVAFGKDSIAGMYIYGKINQSKSV